MKENNMNVLQRQKRSDCIKSAKPTPLMHRAAWYKTKSSFQWMIAGFVFVQLAACATFSDYNLGLNDFNRKNYDAAVSLFNKAAHAGDPAAQTMLGWYWANGLGNTPQNFDEACAWYGTAAKQGFALAINNLGSCHESGNGAEQNTETATALYTLAARKGLTIAQTNLARLGRPVPTADLAVQRTEDNSAENLGALLVILGAAAVAADGHYGSTSQPSVMPPRSTSTHCTSTVSQNGKLFGQTATNSMNAIR